MKVVRYTAAQYMLSYPFAGAFVLRRMEFTLKIPSALSVQRRTVTGG